MTFGMNLVSKKKLNLNCSDMGSLCGHIRMSLLNPESVDLIERD